MQDNYVGDIGDFGKYGMLRLVGYTGLRLAVNWYYVLPTKAGVQNDGKYVEYLTHPELYRKYDKDLFDTLQRIVLIEKNRKIRRVELSGILSADYYAEPLGQDRAGWHAKALLSTQDAEVVFLDPDNGLETHNMYMKKSATEKHVKWTEVRDYYNRGQSVILYQHRPQMTSKSECIRTLVEFNKKFILADEAYLLEFPRYTNRYYFIFAHREHASRLGAVCDYMQGNWQEICNKIDMEDRNFEPI